MDFYFFIDQDDQQVTFISPTFFKVRRVENGITRVYGCDISNARADIIYREPQLVTKLKMHTLYLRSDYNRISIERFTHANRYGNRNERTARQISTSPVNLEYPYLLYLKDGETATDEPATETILFPPPETHEQFMERVSARLLHLTRRIRALRHEEPHQNALSKNICREVPADHAEVLRYDIACNLLKRPIGWLALQLQTQQTRYNSHLAAVEKAKEAGRTPPTFGHTGEYPKLEALLNKIDMHLTEECLEEHFDMHDHAEWDKIQNKQRKITLCDDDYSPGEVLVDVNSFFTDGDGNVAEEHAKRTYHEISTKYWVMAKRTPHRNLVTERIVELD